MVKAFKPLDKRPAYDEYTDLRYICGSEGYVMVRRPYCTPFVMPLKQWEKLPKQPVKKRLG